MKNKVVLVLGDHALDGHEKYEKFLIETNFSVDQVNDAYNLGSQKIGFDFSNDFCDKFEDSIITKKAHDNFLQNGFLDFAKNILHEEYQQDDDFNFLEIDVEKNICFLTKEIFLDLFLFICWLGNNNFEFEIVDLKKSTINIGGYGLF